MKAYTDAEYITQAKLITGDTVWIAEASPEDVRRDYMSRASKGGSLYGAIKDTNGIVTQHLFIAAHTIAYVVHN